MVDARRAGAVRIIAVVVAVLLSSLGAAAGERGICGNVGFWSMLHDGGYPPVAGRHPPAGRPVRSGLGRSVAGHPAGVTNCHTASRAGDRRLRLCHRAEPAELRSIRRRVEQWARGWGMPDDALVDLQLALGEAVANGVEHAYRNAESGTVEVDLDVLGARVVTVRVADHGVWRPAPDHVGHRGRGLMMIERLAGHVQVERTSGGTAVWFEIPFAA